MYNTHPTIIAHDSRLYSQITKLECMLYDTFAKLKAEMTWSVPETGRKGAGFGTVEGTQWVGRNKTNADAEFSREIGRIIKQPIKLCECVLKIRTEQRAGRWRAACTLIINDYAELNTFFEKSEIDWDGDHAIDYCTDPNNADTDGDGSNDNIELIFKEYTDTCHPLKMEATLVKYDKKVHTDANVIDIIYPYSDWSVSGQYEIKKANANEPPWASLAKELAPHMIFEEDTQEFPTSIFFDGDRDMSNNGVPTKFPDGTVGADDDSDYGGDGIRDDVQRIGCTNWGEGYFKEDSNNDDDPADGFTDWERKNELPTVYTKALKGKDPDTGHEILGIQYWFYYVFHDDPN